MEIVNNLVSFFTRAKWVDIEVFNLRASGMIKISRDQVQRRVNKDLSQYYYMRRSKETLEPQEFEDIYVGSKGEEVLKVFSPTKGVYLPIKFMLDQVRDFTEEEKKQLEDIGYTDEEQKKLDNETNEKKKKKLKEQFDKKIEKQKTVLTRQFYKEMYKAHFEAKIDTDTLNHLVYKVQKNALRLQGGGMDLATKISLLIVFMIIVAFINAWVQYNYFIKPGMDFWSTESDNVIKAKELNVEEKRLETGYYETHPPEQIPVPVE